MFIDGIARFCGAVCGCACACFATCQALPSIILAILEKFKWLYYNNVRQND